MLSFKEYSTAGYKPTVGELVSVDINPFKYSPSGDWRDADKQNEPFEVKKEKFEIPDEVVEAHQGVVADVSEATQECWISCPQIKYATYLKWGSITPPNQNVVKKPPETYEGFEGYNPSNYNPVPVDVASVSVMEAINMWNKAPASVKKAKIPDPIIFPWDADYLKQKSSNR